MLRIKSWSSERAKHVFKHWAISLDHRTPQIPYSLKFFTEPATRQASCFCTLGLCRHFCFCTCVLWDWIYSSCLCDKYSRTEPFSKTHLTMCLSVYCVCVCVCWHNYIQDIEVPNMKNLLPWNLDGNSNDETYSVTQEEEARCYKMVCLIII